jgi:hypothetical protein
MIFVNGLGRQLPSKLIVSAATLLHRSAVGVPCNNRAAAKQMSAAPASVITPYAIKVGAFFEC